MCKSHKRTWHQNEKHHAIHKICQNLEAFGSIGHSMAAPRHMEGPRQGGQPGATATSLQQSPTNTRSKPHCRWWHHWTLIPLSQVRDWTHILLDTLSGSSQTEPQWEIRGYIFDIEHLYDKTKQGLQQCGHLLYSWMGRLNTEYGQIPTEVFFLMFFFFWPKWMKLF